jgi:hypothetical protein
MLCTFFVFIIGDLRHFNRWLAISQSVLVHPWQRQDLQRDTPAIQLA